MDVSNRPLAPTRMRLRPLAGFAGLAALLGTTACLDPLDVPNGRVGIIEMPTYESGPDYVVSPVGTFYQKTNAKFNTVEGDTCFIALFSGLSQNVTLETMDVGDELSVVFTDRIEPLPQQSEFGYTFYGLGSAPAIPITPGDSIEVNIPGRLGTYPPFSIKVRTAEAFDHAAIPVPAEGEDIVLTWDPAAEPGAIMTFSLRYAVAPSAGLLNQQVFCGLVDDGTHTIPAGLLGGWRNSLLDTRATVVTRLRYTEAEVDPRTQLVLTSTFARPLLTPP